MGFIKSCRKVSRLSGCHLLHYTNCFCSQKVRLCLEYKGLQWTSHHVDITRGENITAGFFQINPYGVVPVLVHDGTTVIESTDIMVYLENTFPQRPLIPQDQERFAEMKELLALADSVQEAVMCLALHFYYGSRAKKSPEQLNHLAQLCCSARDLYELHLLHREGFTNQQLRTYAAKLHRCLALLETKLSQGRANLVGGDLSLADFSWAPIVHQVLLLGFPVGDYAHVIMWFDIVRHSATFHRAVTAWGGNWRQEALARMQVGAHRMLGTGIEGVEKNYDSRVWLVPVLSMLAMLLCIFCYPAYGVHYGVIIPRSLALYTGCVLVAVSMLFAYQQSHQPRSIPLCQQREARRAVMTALVATDYGGPEVLRLDRSYTRPMVQKASDVLVKVAFGSVSAVDVKVSSGQGHHYFNWLRSLHLNKACRVSTELPMVLGRDFTGVVVEMGEEVTGLEVGQEVWGCVPAWYRGCLAQYVVVDAAWLSRKPRSTSLEEAAAVPFAGCVAMQVLSYCHPRLELRGKRLLVHGGGGGVGSVLVQVAQAMGAHVTVTSSDASAQLLERLGADHIVNYRTHNFASLLQEERFDLVVLLVNSPGLLSASLPLTAPGGSVVTLVHDLETLTSDLGLVMGYVTWLAKWLKTHAVQRLRWGRRFYCVDFSPKGVKHRLELLSQLIDAGKVRPTVQRCERLEDYHGVWRTVASGHAHGKHVLAIP